MCFRVGSRNPVTFKTKLCKSIQQLFPAISCLCHKELHLRCCIGLKLNIVTWSMEILKGIGRHPHDRMQPWGKYEKLILLHALKIHLERFLALNFLYLISNGRLKELLISVGWRRLWLCCKFLCSILVKAHKDLIHWNPT